LTSSVRCARTLRGSAASAPSRASCQQLVHFGTSGHPLSAGTVIGGRAVRSRPTGKALEIFELRVLARRRDERRAGARPFLAGPGHADTPVSNAASLRTLEGEQWRICISRGARSRSVAPIRQLLGKRQPPRPRSRGPPGLPGAAALAWRLPRRRSTPPGPPPRRGWPRR
jgi:hypothetical protein